MSLRMNRAVQHAELIARRYGRDPWLVADRLELPVLREPLPVPFEEIYFALGDGVVGVIISPEVEEPRVSELLAHAIGHHRLHCGNRITLAGRAIWTGRHEREADDFAAALLVSEADLNDYTQAFDPIPVEAAAGELGVTLRLLRRRIALLGHVSPDALVPA